MAKTDPVLAAAGLRQQLGLGSDYVDVFDVLRRLKIELHLAPFGEDSLEGAHTVQGGRAFVFVNTSNSITRQRFTAAHDLGHHVLEDQVDGDSLYEESVVDPGADPAERAAFSFARYFLMDPDGVRRLTGSIKDQDERVAAAASRFVTSIDASCIHLAELDVITTATKNRLLAAIRASELKPAAFLRGFGYPMAYTPKAEGPDLDPRFVQKVIESYRREWLTFAAFADLLNLPPDAAATLLSEHGLPVRDPD